MQHQTSPWDTPVVHLARQKPDAPVLYFSPETLQTTARRFLKGFDGLVTYAVKANPGEEVLANLAAAGVRAFDVASPAEMRAVRDAAPDAVLHYNNPVRSAAEVEMAAKMGVASASVDCAAELEKLAGLPRDMEVTVRLALPVKGAAYDFGAKFGAGPDAAAGLLRQVSEMGFRPGLCFHPGTQCADPGAWGAYVRASAEVARVAGVTLERLNVGGGFAAHRSGAAPDLEAIFDHVAEVSGDVFEVPPRLVCEPGRAMVAEAFTLAARVKALRPDGSLFLNDGIYGALAEARDIDALTRVRVVSQDSVPREGAPVARVVFGPTCDSLDRLPDPLALPGDVAEGDYVLFEGMGAYSRALATRFNGYGPEGPVTVARLI
ncbi:Lysine/ornithine decarboxylase [Roseovarius sp. THAF9]|uniref:type III PLP-dependent enzyme n=1 Tax=Roseovarius sp. THAF9 TaxID=2587847 RepID=UPI0012682BC5|nr:type III PLP-dependent enzyme [Roseovarius sp. THAF9]QFT92047.1 Lysine/ornithine decarboxylase [Roseovarius sp. THAF9]